MSGDLDTFEILRKVSRKYGSTQLRAPSPLDSKVSKENVSSSTGNGSYSKSSNSECANNIYSSVGNTFVFRIRTAPSYLFVLEVSIGKRGERHSRWSAISGLNGDNQCRNCAGVETQLLLLRQVAVLGEECSSGCAQRNPALRHKKGTHNLFA